MKKTLAFVLLVVGIMALVVGAAFIFGLINLAMPHQTQLTVVAAGLALVGLAGIAEGEKFLFAGWVFLVSGIILLACEINR